MQEILDFNAVPGNKTEAHARLVGTGAKVVDTKTLGLSIKDRLDLVKMTLESESSLGVSTIEQNFEPHFFATNFWFLWCSMCVPFLAFCSETVADQ